MIISLLVSAQVSAGMVTGMSGQMIAVFGIHLIHLSGPPGGCDALERHRSIRETRRERGNRRGT
jgi:hypothetical protein